MEPWTSKRSVLELFGGVNQTARAIGCSHVAVTRWPEVLSPKIADRVQAAILRQLPPSTVRIALDRIRRVAAPQPRRQSLRLPNRGA